MTFDEYVDTVQVAAVLFGQRFTRDDLDRAYHSQDAWLHTLPATAAAAAVRTLERNHTGRLTLAALHNALRAQASSYNAHRASVAIVRPDGTIDDDLTAEWHTRNRNPDPTRRPGHTRDPGPTPEPAVPATQQKGDT